MTDYTKRSSDEARTHEMLDGFKPTDDYFTTIQCVKMAFRAMWALSVSVDRIHTVASALGAVELSEHSVKTVLRRMVVAKVLRSRVHNGKRVYEVNY